MAMRTVQTNFTSGELDPLLRGRVDVKHYYNGADKLRNVIVMPQGGARRRFGLEYIDTITKLLARVTAGVTITTPNGSVFSLLHAGGADASTVITDDNANNVWAAVGNAQVDTAQFKFGTGSFLFDGVGDAIRTATIKAYPAGAWTQECFVRFNSLAANSMIFSGLQAAAPGFEGFNLFRLFGFNALSLNATSNGTSWDIANGVSGIKTDFVINQWYHVAAVFDGSSYKIYVDGVLDINVTSSAAVQSAPSGISLGGAFNGDTSLNGWIDEFRYSKSAIYTANFTPPTAAFLSTEAANDDNQGTMLNTSTAVGVINPYVVVRYDLGAPTTVKFADVVGFKLSAGISTDFFIQWSTDDAAWTTLGSAVPGSTAFTNRRVTGPITARYWRFARIGATDLGTATVFIQEFNLWTETASIGSTRLASFTFSNVEHYLMVFSDHNIAVYRAGVLQANVRSPFNSANLSSVSLTPINWTQGLDYMIVVSNDVYPQQLVRQGSHTDWQMDPVAFTTIPFHPFVPVSAHPIATLTPSAVEGNVTLTASAASFNSNDINQYVTGNGGRARITRVTSTTVVKAAVEIPFFDTTAIESGSWTIERGYEAVWSASRGYPVSVCFYESRLVFGGSRDRPSTIWLSRTGLFFDFDRGRQLDDDAIEITIQSDEVPSICNVFPGRHLQVFTTSGEYFFPQAANDPLTPANASVKNTQTNRGSKAGTRVVAIGGATLFIQQQGKALREFLFTDAEQAYNANNISLLSSHLIVNSRDIALHRSISTDEADFVLLVNTDGSLAVLTTLREQGVTAWSLCTTQGSFNKVGIDLTEMYFVTQRIIGGQLVGYLERFNANMRTDAGRYAAAPGLPNLSFDGIDDFVLVPDSPSLQLTTSLTVEARFKISVNDGLEHGIVFKDTETGTRCFWGLYIPLGMNKLRFAYNGASANIDTPNVVTDGIEHHAILTVNATTVSAYFDGVLIGTATPGAQGPPTGQLNIGALPPFTLNVRRSFFPGTIRGIRIYNRAISAMEATEHFNGQFHDETGLVSRWDLREGAGLTAFDSTGTNNGVLTNGPTWINSPLNTLAHLEGQTVDLVLDGAVQSQKTVVGGSVLPNRSATTSIDVGIPFAPLITTMPFARELPDGTVLGRKKRIVETTLELFQTSDILVVNPGGGGAPERPAFQTFGPAGGGSPLDAPIVPFTGHKTIEGIIGWDELGQLSIFQDKPTPMTVLAVELKIKV